jgi:hypothetical protein
MNKTTILAAVPGILGIAFLICVIIYAIPRISVSDSEARKSMDSLRIAARKMDSLSTDLSKAMDSLQKEIKSADAFCDSASFKLDSLKHAVLDKQ